MKIKVLSLLAVLIVMTLVIFPPIAVSSDPQPKCAFNLRVRIHQATFDSLVWSADWTACGDVYNISVIKFWDDQQQLISENVYSGIPMRQEEPFSVDVPWNAYGYCVAVSGICLNCSKQSVDPVYGYIQAQ